MEILTSQQIQQKLKDEIKEFNAANGLETYLAQGRDKFIPPETIRCVYCRQFRYWWKLLGTGWRLVNDAGKIHKCAEYKRFLKQKATR